MQHSFLLAQRGGFVAEAEEEPRLQDLRLKLQELVPDGSNYDVSLREGASSAAAVVLCAWPVHRSRRILFTRSEYASNRLVLMARAEREHIVLAEVPNDQQGRIDLDGLRRELKRGAALVVVPHLASHRGVVQPLAEVAEACREAGVPFIVDATQAFGHIAIPQAADAAAFIGHSRNWLAGPRGVGFALIRSDWTPQLKAVTPGLEGHRTNATPGSFRPLGGGLRFDVDEYSTASRIGFWQALLELKETGTSQCIAALRQIARAFRAELDGLPGWESREPVDEPSCLITLDAAPGTSAKEVRDVLRRRGVLVSIVPQARAPDDLGADILRVSPHLDSDESTAKEFARLLLEATRDSCRGRRT